MKTFKIPAVIAIVSLSVTALSCGPCLANYNTDRGSASTYKENRGTKSAVKEAKLKIAQERDAILAADKRLHEARKTGDKDKIAQVKKEVDQEIKERKAAISSLKDQI